MDTARIAELLDPFLRAPIESAQQNKDEQNKDRQGKDRQGKDQNKEPSNSAPSNITNNVCVLSNVQLEHISTYIDILIRWNSRINLTAIRTPEEIVTRHFGESLFAARHLFPQPSSVSSVSSVVKDFDPPCSVADVGTGAGFPGLPLKIWKPDLSLTLIESNHKKATFLREVTRALTLTDVNIQITRAESIKTKFDVVTLRAVEHFEKILPIAAALVAPAGRLALLISTPQVNPAQSLLPSFAWSTPSPIPNATSRTFLTAKYQ
jgi:16S rRNA (guanine527-N7)-methyltransferase